MSDFTHTRIETRIQEAISLMLLTREIKNPKIGDFIAITSVKLSRDKAYATVYVSSENNQRDLERSVAGLQSAAGFIQGRLGGILSTRHTPRLTFKADTALQERKRVDELLEQISTSDE